MMRRFNLVFFSTLLAAVPALLSYRYAPVGAGSSHLTVLDTVPRRVAPTKDAPVAATKFEKGKALIQKSDCLACHKETEKLVGPAYSEVAKKYKPLPQTITLLANKVIAGGKGVWGEVPMTPHPALALADAKEMVRYVLSLKSK